MNTKNKWQIRSHALLLAAACLTLSFKYGWATPPVIGIVNPVPSYGGGSYVGSPIGSSATLTDDNNVSNCQGTLDGVNWSSGTLNFSTGTFSGFCAAAASTCTDGQNLAINIRATDSLNNTGTGTPISRICDAAPPTTTDNAPTGWQASSVTVTLNATDSGSGVASTRYCTDTSNACTPAIVGTSILVSGSTGSVTQTYVRYRSIDNVGNTESIRSALVRIDEQAPMTTDNAPTAWQASDVTVNLTATDGSGSGVASTNYCTDTTNSCTPNIAGSTITVTCSSGGIAQTYIRYQSVDNVGNTEAVKSALVRIDKQAPSSGSITYPNGITTSPISVSFVTGTDGSGSGLGNTAIQTQQATLRNGSCQTFGSWTTIFTNPASSPVSDSVGSKTCNAYRYIVWDQVGNQTIYTSANIAKVR